MYFRESITYNDTMVYYFWEVKGDEIILITSKTGEGTLIKVVAPVEMK